VSSISFKNGEETMIVVKKKRLLMKTTFILILICLIVNVTGCAHFSKMHKFYPGNKRSREEVVYIRTLSDTAPAYFDDEKVPLSVFMGTSFEILPGEHTLRIGPNVIHFNAKKGHEYYVWWPDNIEDIGHHTSIHNAVCCDNIDKVKEILSNNPDSINESFNGFLPLHMAVRYSNKEMIKTLIEYGANVNASSYMGAPLHLAARGRDGYIANTLIKHGANVNASSDMGTPLSIAKRYQNSGVIILLRKSGAIEVVPPEDSDDTREKN
jgi:Ankyrin repeats (3 copies)/Ankyrin repeat